MQSTALSRRCFGRVKKCHLGVFARFNFRVLVALSVVFVCTQGLTRGNFMEGSRLMKTFTDLNHRSDLFQKNSHYFVVSTY